VKRKVEACAGLFWVFLVRLRSVEPDSTRTFSFSELSTIQISSISDFLKNRAQFEIYLILRVNGQFACK